jgi:hypothetical protein
VERHGFYNLKVGRGEEALDDLRAIAGAFDLDSLSGCEGNGYDLPRAVGTGSRRLELAVRDRSREGRANHFVYLSPRRRLVGLDWVDCERTFPRKDGPGPHPARSIPVVDLAGWRGVRRLVPVHVPPDWPGAGPARDEYVRLLARAMNSTRAAALAPGDYNHSRDRVEGAVRGGRSEGPGPTDAATGRRVRFEEVAVRHVVGDRPLGSDHRLVVYGVRASLR